MNTFLANKYKIWFFENNNFSNNIWESPKQHLEGFPQYFATPHSHPYPSTQKVGFRDV